MSNPNTFRQVGAGTTFLSPTDFLVQVNTSQGAVTLILPKISTILDSYTTIYQYMGIRIVDVSDNASVNNITIAGFETNKVNEDSNFVISSNGGGAILTLIGDNQWALQQNTSSVGAVEYKQATLPNTSISPFAKPNSEIVGDVFDLGTFIINGSPFVRLNNGNIASVEYCQSVLINGILIYEAYDLQTTDLIDGYWLAFKQNDQNPELLEKVAECKMTQQFWDMWYNWTLKDSGDNVVKFVVSSYPISDSNLIESWITKLTYSNGVLTAEDIYFNFGGNTTLSLYNSLSGLAPILSGKWQYAEPEYILDDDYYGMGIGDDFGWMYFRNYDAITGNNRWLCVGFNIITGATKSVDTITIGLSTITNFDWASFGGSGNEYNAFGFMRSHPKGLFFGMADKNAVNNGNNNDGVTALWSPLWTNNTKVIYLNVRDVNFGNYLYTGSSTPFGSFPNLWYWDSNNFYIVNFNSVTFSYNLMATRYNIDSKEITIWNFPSFDDYGIISFAWIWANNNSLMFNTNLGKGSNYAGQYDYYILSNEEPLRLQSNNYYPTNMLGDKSYSTSSGMNYNVLSVGCEIDQWKGVNF